jgi:hypothetical protein
VACRSYSFDGVHWGCDAAAHAQAEQAAAGGPFRCRSLGNTAAAVIVANLLCNDMI